MRKPRINPKWYELPQMSELAEYLQSVPSFELTKRVASEISELTLVKNPRRVVIESFILLARQFMRELYVELGPDLEQHSRNYPFIRMPIPLVAYDSARGRVTYQKVQSFLRKMPMIRGGFLPRKIQNPVVPIILPGVDYSAESLVHSLSLTGEELPDKSRLGWHISMLMQIIA